MGDFSVTAVSKRIRVSVEVLEVAERIGRRDWAIGIHQRRCASDRRRRESKIAISSTSETGGGYGADENSGTVSGGSVSVGVSPCSCKQPN